MFVDSADRDVYYLERELSQLIKEDLSLYLRIKESRGIWFWDLENLDNSWLDENFYRELGYQPSPGDHRSSRWQSLIDERDRKHIMESLQRSMGEEDFIFSRPIRYRKRNGDLKTLHCRAWVIRREDRPVRILGIHRETGSVQEGLGRDHGDDSLFMQVPVPLILLDKNGVLRHINAKAEALLNLTADGEKRGDIYALLRNEYGASDNERRLLSGWIKECLVAHRVLSDRHIRIEKESLGGKRELKLTFTPLRDRYRSLVMMGLEDVTDSREIDRIIDRLYRNTYQNSGDEFFRIFFEELGRLTKIDLAMVVMGGDQKVLETLSVMKEGRIIENFSLKGDQYPFKEIIASNGPVCRERDGESFFRGKHSYLDGVVEGILGYPLRNRKGEIIGFFLIMARSPLERRKSLDRIIGVFSPRLSREIMYGVSGDTRAPLQSTYQVMIKGLPDNVNRLDNGNRFVFMSLNSMDFFNRKPEDFVGRTVEECGFSRETTHIWIRELERVRRKKTIIESEYSWEQWGRTYDYHWRLIPELDKEGQVISVVTVSRDITDSKRMEREKEELENQLNQAEKMQAIGQLAGGIAHDFNNQLMGILGYCELLDSLETEEEKREYISQIHSSATNAADLTKQLLVYSRKGYSEKKEVDVRNILSQVTGILKRSLNKNIMLETRGGETESLILMGDSSLIQNAILNLALNGRDAMPEGGLLTIQLDKIALDREACDRMAFEVEPGDFVEISVIDRGTGIDGETKQKIFEPFFTTKEEGKGTGMGLAAVYGTAIKHGGAILVDSVPGEGSRFSLLLPLLSKGKEKIKPR